MKHHRLTLFAILIFVITLIPVYSYANEAGVGNSTGSGQVNNNMNMPGHDMSGHTMEMPNSYITGQPEAVPEQPNPQANDTTDSSAGDMSNHNMNMMGHDMQAGQPAHDMMNMPGHGTVQNSNDHQAMGHEGSTTGLNPSAKEVNRAGLLGGFGFVDGLILLGALIFKWKTKVGGSI